MSGTGRAGVTEQADRRVFEAPFEPDATWVQTLAPRLPLLRALYFGLHLKPGLDARYQHRHCSPEQLAAFLSDLPGPRRHGLLNAAFQPATRYTDTAFLDDLARTLETLRAAGALDALVYADALLLRALGEHAPSVCQGLPAQPSVNLCLDSPAKVRAHLDFLAATPFAPPQSLIADRSLNRRPQALAELRAWLGTALPHAELGLLANEGCLRHCPFKPAHDAVTAAAGHFGGAEACWPALREQGCLRLLAAEPWRALASPFIRPEDAGAALARADFLKLCGRGRPPAFIARVLDAYAARDGGPDLFALMDTLAELAVLWRLDSARLPAGFAATFAACPLDCSACGRCATLFAAASTARPALDSL